MSNVNYLKLVTSSHWDKPKFVAWLEEILTPPDEITTIIDGLQENFNINTAVGNQLDILGQLVGRSRNLDFQPSVSSPTMDDDTYRFAIKAKAAQNHWDGTIPGLYSIWAQIFPLLSIKVTDNQDMTCDILFVGQNFTVLEKELITNGYVIPKTQCVGFSYTFGGTFSFRISAVDDPYTTEDDVLAGFSDVTQVDGGYFGSVS
jgi:hypothetical protein